MPIKALVFDVEGTLFRSKSLTDAYRNQVLKLVSEKRGLDGESLLKEVKRVIVELRKEGYDQRPPSTLIAERLGLTREEFYKAIESVDPIKHVNPDPRLVSALKELKKRFKLAILTNLSRRSLLGVFKALGLSEELFDVVLTADELEHLKPHPSAFTKVIKELEVRPEEVVMVGDIVTSDLAPAKGLGMKTVLVSEEKQTNSPLVDLTVSHVAELEEKIHVLQQK